MRSITIDIQTECRQGIESVIIGWDRDEEMQNIKAISNENKKEKEFLLYRKYTLIKERK